MVVVIFILFAWFCIQVLIGLLRKLPLVVNFLLFMAIEVVLINKLTISYNNLKLFKINTSLPLFIALILHNDFTVTFVLLAFANVFLTTPKTSVCIGISIYTFLFQILIGFALRWNHVLIDKDWNFFKESMMIIILMVYTLLLGRIFQRMASKEGWIR
ncbi:hypothetical protein E2980_15360 [Cohnella luojiensis]|uniref:Uncharacterized protein n=1 Tax=Cohnella luojiensis TaxID=652876 RepID=A0A4Y8LT66_9BACL|nr:hypothetical protein E2980_15360 [Cohnella luojiensis]